MSKIGTVEEGKKVIEEIMSHYPDKTKKDRVKHIEVVDGSEAKSCMVSNRKSKPGVITMRGCAYAGAKGVVWGPIKDAVHISHGPVGCGQYSWATRRNYYNGITGVDSFGNMQFTSDFQEKDIVFGGDKKLIQVIEEAEELFPLNKGMSVLSECPVGLIGDDIEAIAKQKAKELEKPVVPVRCEGFRGVSQSLGHHIANDSIRDSIFEAGVEGAPFEQTPYDIALFGDYNIGGDIWSSRKIFDEMGLNLVSQATGDASMNEIANMTKGKLMLIHCYRSMNYIARYIEEKHGIPWEEFNFFGPTQIQKSMRNVASKFDDKIIKKTEELINDVYIPEMQKVIDKYKKRLEGKTVMLMVGGLRPRHTIPAFEDLGLKVIVTGYEFAHGDDYQRTLEYVKDTTIVVDDMTEFEMEKLIKEYRPDMFGSGIKEKYQTHKVGLPFRQMHSWDYSGPYHGVDGFAVFARDIDMAINGPIWKKVTPPWKEKKVS